MLQENVVEHALKTIVMLVALWVAPWAAIMLIAEVASRAPAIWRRPPSGRNKQRRWQKQ